MPYLLRLLRLPLLLLGLLRLMLQRSCYILQRTHFHLGRHLPIPVLMVPLLFFLLLLLLLLRGAWAAATAATAAAA